MTTPPPAIRKILVGIDGSDRSARALQWAANVATLTGASISAVTVWNYPPGMMLPLVGGPVVPVDIVSEKTRTLLDSILADADLDGVDYEDSVVMGAARQVLTEQSAEHDLLVIGRTGDGRLKQALLGSTVSHLARHAECPVVVVGDTTGLEKKITVAVDGSPSSVQALQWALAVSDDDTEILAVFSHDEWELDEMALDSDARADLDRAADEMLTTAVRSAVEAVGADPDRVLRQVRQGDPRTTLVEQADPSRMLVLGAQGHSGIARWALGSLADFAVNHAPGTVAIWR